MYIRRKDTLIKEIMEEFDIPFTTEMIENINDILTWTHFNFDSIEKFKILVEYLKERDTKDIYGRSKDDPEFTGKMATDGWLYYLGHYAFYVSTILRGPGMNWLYQRKYLFPRDVYDIVYRYQNDRNNLFLKYMEEKHPESYTQINSYKEKIEELRD